MLAAGIGLRPEDSGESRILLSLVTVLGDLERWSAVSSPRETAERLFPGHEI